MNSLRTLKIVLSILFALLGGSGVYLAWLSIAVARLENTLYEQANEPTGSVLWGQACAQARRLARIANWDPATLDLAGRVFLQQSELETESPRLKISALREAKNYLEHSSQLRPTWPYTRLNLARIEFELDANGPWAARLDKALALNLRGNALALDLLRFRRRLGLHLTGELARQVEANFSSALRDAPEEMVRAATDLGRREWACAEPINTNVKTLCANMR
jgi:hypothetical protein